MHGFPCHIQQVPLPERRPPFAPAPAPCAGFSAPRQFNGISLGRRVRILGTVSDAADAGLRDKLNQLGTVFPGTGLHLAYELPPKGGAPGATGS